MLEIAEFIDPKPSLPWQLAKQSGADLAVGGLSVAGLESVLRPDHLPTVEGRSNEHAGYSSFRRLYAIGHIRGLGQAVYAEQLT